MRCCVKDCKNDSRHKSKLQGITFHTFPIEKKLRTSWLKAVNKPNWVPRERSAVCSQHFLASDLYHTPSGLRRVRVGAVPIVLEKPEESVEPVSLQVCRICLEVETKLFSIRKHNKENLYELLTGITLEQSDTMPQSLCSECIHRLVKYNEFRNQSHRAFEALMSLVDKGHNVTLNSIKTIDRKKHQLTSPLTKVHFNNHYDMTIECKDVQTSTVNEPMQRVDIEIEPIEIDIKTEPTTETDVFDHQNDNDLKQNDFNKPIIDLNELDVNKESNINLKEQENKLIENDIQEHSDNDSNKDEPESDIDTNDKDPDFDTNNAETSEDEIIKLPKYLTKVKIKKKPRKTDPYKPKIDRRRKPLLNEDLNETLFTIVNLTYSEQVAEIEKRQETSNYKNASYKCMLCYKGFLDEEAFNSHSLRHTNKCGEAKCTICKIHFKHNHALRKHVTAHHIQRFKCNLCPYITTHRQTARLHERWHNGTRYQCPHCSDDFVKFTTYMGHIRIKHPSDFVCSLCGYSFVSEKGIQLHKKLKHRLDDVPIPPDGPYCDLCKVRFVSTEAHIQHLRVSGRHTETKVKEPKEANDSRKSPRKLKENRDRMRDRRQMKKLYPSQMRKAEGPIPCEQCGMELEDSRAYHGHFRRMHPDKNRTNYPSMKSPCMCEVCGKIFQSYALLKDHTYVHTGERPFKCDQCTKSFRMKQRLTAHRRVHAKVKTSYACSVCNKAFTTHSNRQRHMFIHTGLRPFKCEMCGKGFKHSSEKRAHITYVHLKKPWPKRQRGKRSKLDSQIEINQEVRELDIQPIWPNCPENKMADSLNVNAMMQDKSVYYNLKI